MRIHQAERIFGLTMGDCIAMFIAFSLALFFGHHRPIGVDLFFYYKGSIVALFASTLVIFFILDLYSLSRMREGFFQQLPAAALGLFLGSVFSTFLFFFFRNPVPRAVFILFYGFSLLLILFLRVCFNRLSLSSSNLKVLVVGEEKPCANIARLISERKYLGSEVIGYVSCHADPSQGRELRCLGNLDSLPRLLKEEDIDHLIVATARIGQELIHRLLECMHRKVKIIDYRKVTEDIAGKVPIEYLDDYWFFFSLRNIDKEYFWYGKRAFDLFVSAVGLSLSLPLFPFVALLIKLDSPGPVFYSQTRVGREGRRFRVWKLRTMRDGADKTNVYWTTDNDDRITKLGRFIRKTHIDEIPQLLNILKGDMSLIGPRPEAEALAELYEKEIPYYHERYLVTPGITGWAQINYPYGNSIDDTREKLKFDFYYIKNRGWVLDAVIFLKTIRTVLTGRGAL